MAGDEERRALECEGKGGRDTIKPQVFSPALSLTLPLPPSLPSHLAPLAGKYGNIAGQPRTLDDRLADQHGGVNGNAVVNDLALY
jgi:hypothetical protein